MKTPKKVLKQIGLLSFMRDIIIAFPENFERDNKTLWVDLPPTDWSKDETRIFDMLNEHEMKLKEAVFEILDPDGKERFRIVEGKHCRQNAITNPAN